VSLLVVVVLRLVVQVQSLRAPALPLQVYLLLSKLSVVELQQV
jgi:hypothetical protein